MVYLLTFGSFLGYMLVNIPTIHRLYGYIFYMNTGRFFSAVSESVPWTSATGGVQTLDSGRTWDFCEPRMVGRRVELSGQMESDFLWIMEVFEVWFNWIFPSVCVGFARLTRFTTKAWHNLTIDCKLTELDRCIRKSACSPNRLGSIHISSIRLLAVSTVKWFAGTTKLIRFITLRPGKWWASQEFGHVALTRVTFFVVNTCLMCDVASPTLNHTI